jgi:hypothetical protein
MAQDQPRIQKNLVRVNTYPLMDHQLIISGGVFSLNSCDELAHISVE